MDTHLTSKKNPAHLTQPSKRQKTSLARRQGGESRRLSTGQLGDGVGSARGHNLCSLEAVRLVGVEVLVTHTPPQLDDHEDQDEQHEHRGAMDSSRSSWASVRLAIGHASCADWGWSAGVAIDPSTSGGRCFRAIAACTRSRMGSGSSSGHWLTADLEMPTASAAAVTVPPSS